MKKLLTLSVLVLVLFIGCQKDSDLMLEESYSKVTQRTLQCNAPSNLTVTNVTNNTISVKWNKQQTAEKYRLEWTSLASGVWIYEDTPDTTYTVPGLYPGHTYRIRVKSLCQGWVNGTFLGASSVPSSEVQVTTINNTGVCVDMYEYNNTSGVSKPIIFNRLIEGKISKPQTTTDKKGKTLSFPDYDWFSFYTSTRFTVDLYDLPQNYDLEVYRTVNNSSRNIILVASSKNLGNVAEKITVSDFMRYERYYIRVLGNIDMSYNDDVCYKLKLTSF